PAKTVRGLGALFQALNPLRIGCLPLAGRTAATEARGGGEDVRHAQSPIKKAALRRLFAVDLRVSTGTSAEGSPSRASERSHAGRRKSKRATHRFRVAHE